ncbi:serine/threonine protein kinase [Actinokineospora sp. PR83]|uniref:serine/threonine-protein kinase n=1 Tax=Actinokineospora sp. PR83 TaxID=2884908 RepID=UPI0027DF7956|nr:serine/threonine-protein kinase [Actinokineospora sp. PR83]MCG8916249.1 serine/threonine protein kinase [Actinokineospora sp. PR83]
MTQEQGPTVAHGSRVVAGRYAILNELGRGGMGVVWLAEDRMIGRNVAIKELHLPEGVPHDERRVFEERVLREARTAGRLNDPAVVTVYDVVQEAGATYIVMELIQAPTLSDVVKERGPLPPEQVTVLAEQLLSALEAAHQAGIIHRDVKPSNIMLANNNRVKLTDFGIAQSLDDPRLTSSGMLIGSPTYMAPERIRGEEAHASSDLWALGAVLFFAIEGYSPFERPTTAATMHAILAEVPYLTRAQGALASVITGLMVATPQARLNAAQVRGLLAHVRTGPPTGPHGMATPQHTGPVPTQNTVFHPPQPQHGATRAVQPPGDKRWSLKPGVVFTVAAVVAVLALVGGIFLNRAFTATGSGDAAPKVETYTYGPGGDLTEFNLAEGYCSNNRLQRGAGFSSSGNDCKKTFLIEVFGTITPLNSSYTLGYDATGLEATGKGYCGWMFNTERVIPEKRKDLMYSVVYPSEQTWKDEEDSSRYTIYCVLSGKDGQQLTGSQVNEYK